MRKNIRTGLFLGIVFGLIDMIPMIIQKLTWDANLSAFFLWVVSGILLASSDLKLPAILKGIVISFLCLLPCAVLIGWKEPFSLIPICIMTLILGGLLGFVYEKISK